MSYPSVMQALVIEDEPGVKAVYEQIFAALGDHFPVVAPCCAFSLHEALGCLERERIFHLIILDLRLPESNGLPAPETEAYGMRIVRAAEQRAPYPIPGLLVITGHLGSTDQTALRSEVERSFHYGRVIAKGDRDQLQREVERALEEVQRWVGIGIHIGDAGNEAFPTLSPAEDDAMRRFILQSKRAIGVDLKWWSAKRFSNGVTDSTWTKVLHGRLLFAGDRPSRHMFFKVTPVKDSQSVIEAAQAMEHKLNHFKLVGTVESPMAALIVTEKMGAGDRDPISLRQVLADAPRPDNAVETIARDVVNQLQMLGDRNSQNASLKELLWPHHDLSGLRKVVDQHADASFSEYAIDPVVLLQRLMADESQVMFTQQSFLHGDMHIDNVALDDDDGDGVKAYIFDAGATGRHVDIKDVAALEVSILLHQARTDGTRIVASCQGLYSAAGLIPHEDCGESSAKNTYRLIRALRSQVENTTTLRIYALTLFDYAMVQLGGLCLGLSNNKISDPKEALLLAYLTARWYQQAPIGEP